MDRREGGTSIRWYDESGRYRKRTFKGITKENATRRERAILAARDAGEAWVDPRHAPLFSAFADTWLEENRARWKAGTLAENKSILNGKLKSEFGEKRLSHISESSILTYITKLNDDGLSPRRINHIVALLKQILRTAHRRRIVRVDPCTDVKKLKEARAEIDPFSPEEIQKFLAVCPEWWRAYFLVAFWTGARPNELAALKWSEVDTEGRTFRVRAGRYRGIESAPKTEGSVRDIDLLPAVVDALKNQKARQAARRLSGGQGGTKYVFTGSRGDPFHLHYLREKIWYPGLKKAGLRRRTLYQTRHSFASNALAAGEDPAWVQKMLVHSTLRQLFGTYARWIPNRTRLDGSLLTSRMAGEGESDGRAVGAETL
jgi:integrase